MSRFTILAAALAILAVLGFLSAPWFALSGLQAAARDGDVHALAELVDYGAVRAGLQAQLAPEPSAPAPKLWEDPVGAVARAMQPPQARANVERHLTAPGLHALAGDPEVFPSLRTWGPSRVRFAVGPQDRTLLTFHRQGLLRWRMVQLGLQDKPAPSR